MLHRASSEPSPLMDQLRETEAAIETHSMSGRAQMRCVMSLCSVRWPANDDPTIGFSAGRCC